MEKIHKSDFPAEFRLDTDHPVFVARFDKYIKVSTIALVVAELQTGIRLVSLLLQNVKPATPDQFDDLVRRRVCLLEAINNVDTSCYRMYIDQFTNVEAALNACEFPDAQVISFVKTGGGHDEDPVRSVLVIKV